MNIEMYVEGLVNEAIKSVPEPDPTLEAVLKGVAIELWSTASGRLFLIVDEGDARLACQHFGARRGEIYTAVEARRIIAVDDRSAVAEIHDWKRRFDGVISNENR